MRPGEEMVTMPTPSGAGGQGYVLGFRLTFLQGFFVGQLSVIVLALLAIRFIIFEDSKPPPSHERARSTSLPIRSSRKRKSISSKEAPHTDAASAAHTHGFINVRAVMADILAKVHYEMDSHASESIDWVNVIFAQALAGYRHDVLAGGWTSTSAEPSAEPSAEQPQRTARDWMEEVLNDRTIGRGMSFLDPIQVIDVHFGDSYPTFSNAKVRPADDTGRMRIEMDVDYTDCIHVSIETKLLINFPKPRFAVLPISLGLNIDRFSGTLALELFSTAASTVLPQSSMHPPLRSRHDLHISLHPDFALDASATSLVGSRAKLQDVPKIEQLLVGRVRSYIHDRYVWPQYWSLTLPNLVPRNITSSGQPFPPPEEEEKRGTMQVVGQGNALHDAPMVDGTSSLHESIAADSQRGLFFETDPPLFPKVFHPSEHRLSHTDSASLPGSLPTVEAWRSQAAASGASRARGAPSDLRQRQGPSNLSESSQIRRPTVF